MANGIQQIQKPTLIISHNKTLAAQLYSEMKEFFPENAVEYFVSYYDYYQPEAYVPGTTPILKRDPESNGKTAKYEKPPWQPFPGGKEEGGVATASNITG